MPLAFSRRPKSSGTPRRPRGPWALESLESRRLMDGSKAGAIGSIAPLEGPQKPVGDWTVMVYLTATDLAANAPPNIREMENAAAAMHPGGDVQIVVLYDQWAGIDSLGRVSPNYSASTAPVATGGGSQAPWSTAGVGLITPARGADAAIQTSFTISTDEVDTGSQATLENFIAYAALLAPARHYALVMWDHGAGVEGFNFDSYDVLADDRLTTSEMAAALTTSRDRDAVAFDLVAFDECLMSTVEVAYALRDLTRIMVASEEVVPGEGMDYKAALSVFEARDAGLVDGDDLARSMVESYARRHGGTGKGITDTLAATRTAGLSDLAGAIGGFVTASRSAGPDQWPPIARAWSYASYFNTDDRGPNVVYRDLGQFMARVEASPSAPGALRAAAARVAARHGPVLSSATSRSMPPTSRTSSQLASSTACMCRASAKRSAALEIMRAAPLVVRVSIPARDISRASSAGPSATGVPAN